MQASQDIWLSVWTRAEAVVADPSMRFYMSVYIAIGMGGIAIGFVRGIVLILATLRASQVRCLAMFGVSFMSSLCAGRLGALSDSGILFSKFPERVSSSFELQAMHDRLLDKVFSLPMAFFDTQPSGRLISRFSKDVGATDLNMTGVIFGVSTCIVGTLVTTAVVIGVTRGAVLLALVPLVPMYLSVQRHYLATSRELNRLQNVTSSPILSNFGETLAGLMTVRAFRKQARTPLSCRISTSTVWHSLLQLLYTWMLLYRRTFQGGA